jgi:pimeloyl-ACP methyl ester carboxylesterase
MARTIYRNVDVDGLKIFYRESGPEMAETIVLLHGFPTSSHMFRNLIPILSEQYSVVAPDLPGFGQSEMPPRDRFAYTFENIAKVMTRFTEVIALDRFALYIFDYGAPVGLRMALEHPERVAAIISQNGNAYEEGLSDAWKPIRAYWTDRTDARRDALRPFLTPETTMWQYTEGVPDRTLVSPDGYCLDNYYLARQGADEVQLDLLLDYESNVALYPKFRQYFREKQPPMLAVWGCNDPFFLPAGAEAFKRDNPNAQVRLLDTGHFALETHNDAIASAIVKFLTMKLSKAMARSQ